MKVYITSKQYELINKTLLVMTQLYNNDFFPMFQLIAKNYGVDTADAKRASDIISSLHLTESNKAKAKQVRELHVDFLLNADPVEGIYRYAMEIDGSNITLLGNVMDAFSRIMMGQFRILFEVVDVKISDSPRMIQMYRDVYWEGGHRAKEARDLLLPKIKKFGWYGGFGISNPEVAEDSRLAYQISRALRREYVLPVTQEPLVQLR